MQIWISLCQSEYARAGLLSLRTQAIADQREQPVLNRVTLETAEVNDQWRYPAGPIGFFFFFLMMYFCVSVKVGGGIKVVH